MTGTPPTQAADLRGTARGTLGNASPEDRGTDRVPIGGTVPVESSSRHARGVAGWALCGQPTADVYVDDTTPTCPACIRAHVDVCRAIVKHDADIDALRHLAIIAGRAADLLSREAPR